MKLTRFEDLDCWKEARQLTRLVYDAIHQNPRWQKDIRLCSQIQSATGSVMANIAEGFVRRSNKEFTQFLFIAMSSTAEVQSHMYIAMDQDYVSKGTFDSIYEQANKTARITSGLIRYLRTKQTK
ncbi:MAG: four helix bundle protein [Nitrospirota bacterium]|jgi:four helix bundle protein